MQRPVLPNSPLTEVVAEIRFHGNLSLYEGWSRLQRKLKLRFPKLLVPGAEPGTSPLLQPLRLTSADDRDSLLLAVNSFGYTVRTYKGFEDFRTEFSRFLAEFLGVCPLESVNRFGLRYVNVLPTRLSGPPAKPQAKRLHDCLKLEISGWSGGPDAFSEPPLIALHGPVDDLNLRLALVPPSAQLAPATMDGSLQGVQFDIDCFKVGPFPVQEISSVLDKAHAKVDATFFGLITPEYERYLKGE